MKLRTIRKRMQRMFFHRKRYFFGVRGIKNAQRLNNMQFSNLLDLIGKMT